MKQQPKFILGAHSLSVMFTINNIHQLQKAMEQAVAEGATLFEMPFLLCKIPWKTVARLAKAAGIKEIALCHFWPRDKKNGALCGDPLGTPIERARALIIIDSITIAADILRSGGITVRFIDGPTHACLGWKYSNITLNTQYERAVSFLQDAGDICAESKLILAVEFLRPVEDKVVAGTNNMIGVLRRVGRPNVMLHFDIFHSLENDEDPAVSIAAASAYIAYIHFHGSKRRIPGSRGDKCDWESICYFTNRITSCVKNIPCVPEPFGEATRRENKALGKGLPATPDLPEYLSQAYATFRRHGLRIKK